MSNSKEVNYAERLSKLIRRKLRGEDVENEIGAALNEGIKVGKITYS